MLIRSAIVLAFFVTTLPAAEDKSITYLALGDSIAFGYDPFVQIPTTPDHYIGYPEVVAKSKHLNIVKFENLSCPGDTSGSFSSVTAPDNNCRLFRSVQALHVNYQGTQMSE